MTTFPLGWLDLHHSESVLGLQPGEVGFAFSPLRTYRWKCYYNEEARTTIYQFCQNLILSASRLASSFSLSSFTFLARSAYAYKEINEHVLCQACKVLCKVAQITNLFVGIGHSSPALGNDPRYLAKLHPRILVHGDLTDLHWHWVKRFMCF